MTWTIVGIVVLGTVAGLGGFASLLVALYAPSRRLVRPVRGGDVGGRCPCCRYSTEGLEDDRCPECGRVFELACLRVARMRRVGLACVGVALGMVAMGSYPAADAARFGMVHPLPSMVLAQMLWIAPWEHADIARELQGRADAGQLGEWTRASLARACSRVVVDEQDRGARRDAAWLLTRVVRYTDPTIIARMVQDKDSGVRAMGVEALRLSESGGEGGATSTRLNALALGDSSELVRKRAIDAMRYRSEADGRMTSTLLMALEDPSDGVRQRAILALGEEKNASEESMRAVARRAGDESADVRWVATVALGRMAACRPEALELVAGSLADVSPMVRASAVSTLGQTGGDRAWVLPRLVEAALGDEDEVVRGVAMEAIRAIAG